MEKGELPLWWEPSKEGIESSSLNKFRKAVNAKYKLDLATYEDIHKFSVDRLTDFWETLWDFVGIRYHRKYDQVLTNPNARPGELPRFFEGALINLAENALFPLHPKNVTACMPHAPKDWPYKDSIAIYEYGEASASDNNSSPPLVKQVTWGELRRRVAVLSTVFRRKGLKAGDRVAHVSANSANPIVSFLATLAIGAVFSALPTDAGEQAIYGRLSQIQPRLVLTDDFALYNGKEVNVVDRVATVADLLLQNKKVSADPKSFEVVCFLNDRGSRKPLVWRGKKTKCSSLQDYLQSANLDVDSSPPLTFDVMPFNHPALIVFSSGTTGEPKSICHSAGGILVNSKKESILHFDLGAQDTFLQLTTTGWIMWLTMVGNLMASASIITYDGSPLFPSPLTIPRLISNHKGKLTGFGGSPRLLAEIERHCNAEKIAKPRDVFHFSNLRYVTSTGSPLSPANVRFFYERFMPTNVHLISISGGTDLAGCFVASAPNVPVRGHLIGVKCLGMDLRILDPISGEDVEMKGEAGELVTARPFPTQPLYFWGAPEDKEKLHAKYMESYYQRYTEGPAINYWAQGDFISRDLKTGGFEIHGRSDGVLNPSGVRFGSAEIYSVVESGKFTSVLDSVVVGQRRPGKDEDETVLLFVKCKAGSTLGDEEKKAIGTAIREAHSARHVPKYIFQVQDIPITANGKKTELAVKAIVSGNTAFKASTATANPEALDEYRQYADIEGVVAKRRSSKL
ncbi:hypothetical protein CBS101457_006010 [Exobasidium rhododendri]|nr:hypothetical protein CBS101457_006010 [Exobasidium rhododendri]